MGGTLALVALYVLVQTGTADKLQLGSTVLVRGFQRLLSPEVAGVPRMATSPGGAAGKAFEKALPSTTTTPPATTVLV